MSDMERSVISTVLSWGLALVFTCVAVYDVKRTSPAQFIPWIKIQANMLTSVRDYNRENCNMLFSCAFVFVLVGFAGFISVSMQAILYVLCLFPGSYIIYKRYKRILCAYLKEDAAKTE